MTKIKNGDTVTVHYTGSLKDGSVFDTSHNREPLKFTMGAGQLIPGFEKAVEGMAEGDSTKVTIPAEEAYGLHREDLVISVPADNMPEGMSPEIGMQLQMNQPDGQAVPVRITAIDEEEITLDANHPLAGEDLVFEIEVIQIAAV